MEYTEQQKKFLEMLFRIGYEILNTQGSYIEFKDGTYCTAEDIYYLKEKLGIDMDF